MSAKDTSFQATVDWILEFSDGKDFTCADKKNLKSKNDTGQDTAGRCYGGLLSQLALHKLSLLCTSSNSLEGWSGVDVESLSYLLEHLREHVDSAVSVDLFREATNALVNGHHGASQVCDMRALDLIFILSVPLFNLYVISGSIPRLFRKSEIPRFELLF